jgi:hypothetical protein
MKNPFTRGLAILALSSLMFIQVAQAITTDLYTDDTAITITLSGSLNAEGKVDLSWSQYTGTNFMWYKVVHSQTNNAPKYPMDDYIDLKTSSTDTTYIHTAVPAGTNYYSVCVITTDSKRGCSNTVTITKSGNTEAVPVYPYTDDANIQLTLTGALNADGNAALNWTKYSGADLKWYKVVHSQTDDTPKYPENAYIEVFSDVNVLTYTHTAVPAGVNYYSVCVITTADKRGCSNTLTLTKGDVTTTTTAAFPDVEGHWAKNYVTELYNEGVVEGRDGNFMPDTPILRSEAFKVVLLGLGYQAVACDSSIFPDLKDGDWFCGVVTKAYILGVVEGDNGYLFPARDLTRAEALKVLFKTKGIEPPAVDTAPFPDVNPTDWYAGYVYKAKLLGWIQGIDGKFEPNRNITRAELAKLVTLASN